MARFADNTSQQIGKKKSYLEEVVAQTKRLDTSCRFSGYENTIYSSQAIYAVQLLKITLLIFAGKKQYQIAA